jgi:hypothetical protein
MTTLTKTASAPASGRVWTPPSQQRAKMLRWDFDTLNDSDRVAFIRSGGLVTNVASEANVTLPGSAIASPKAAPAKPAPAPQHRRSIYSAR